MKFRNKKSFTLDNVDDSEILIFCQAPADLQYVLSICVNPTKKKISIFVINVISLYNFLQTLNLNVNKIVFIPYTKLNVKNPISILKNKLRIFYLINTYFKKYKNINVYFFSRFEDWLTFSFIYFFEINSATIFYVDHYDSSISNSNPKVDKIKFSRFFLGCIFKFITNADLLMDREFRYPEFPISKYNIIKINPVLDKSIFDKYSYNISINIHKKNMIFFLSPPDELLFDFKNYDSIISSVLNSLLKNNYKIFIKGHPRVGLPTFISSENISKYDIDILPSYIPGEFINVENLDLCIGIDSTILSIIAERKLIKTFCLINLFTPVNLNFFNSIRDYLQFISQNELIFLDSIDQFKSILYKDE